jgi:hypothetical protein
MSKRGRKYPLVIYTRMMDRWWPPVFLIGLAMLALAWWTYSDLYIRLTAPWKWMLLGGAGGLCILASLLMLVLRQAAYVQPRGDHLLLATPFLRMKISYKRIRRTRTATMAVLFPISKMGLLKRDTVSPLLPMTAVILELSAVPMPRSFLRLFLSPFFFVDNAPHIVLLVKKWMAFSAELDSMRVPISTPAITERRAPPSSILSRLPRR